MMTTIDTLLDKIGIKPTDLSVKVFPHKIIKMRRDLKKFYQILGKDLNYRSCYMALKARRPLIVKERDLQLYVLLRLTEEIDEKIQFKKRTLLR